MEDRIAYFDNAATTFPKPDCVYDYADAFYRSSGGNIGRGGNALAARAGDVAKQTKENIRQLYSCGAKKVVFTASATDALNRILFGLEISASDSIYVSPFEHNAVTRPVHNLEVAHGVTVNVLPFDVKSCLPDMSAIQEAFERKVPRLLVLTHASNVCGAVLPVMELCTLAKRYGATTVLDMSQTAGLLPLDLGSDLFDYAVFAGHKTLYAPFGIGGFVCRREARLAPVLFGGNGINSIEQDMPDDIVQMVEVGSQNTYAIAGLKASTDWLLNEGMDVVRAREATAKDRLLALLRERDCLTVVGDGMGCEQIGVVSTLFDGYTPDEIEMILGKYGVAVRSGIQCAPYAHRFLGTLPGGTVRFSVSAMTSDQDFRQLEAALEAICDEG
ncbi:aminotransferase class V-fold PLP-dependent enzyme [Atopobium sp. oral taxon 810]|uniref:aminotransferase class V-fold PLP-dependent enzyme n=1 Tax=Atopobium sp. oral taxon 810 TaxID=712158 RepID=UPI00039790B7|nr:aminotransferase class V-fold PLP-dependent enzyme [Atopobium sp. oral taxon 810]ERI06367.1 cysteine desulfurase family protein [Atopobium sp. oral taxon 810 str. F0209]